MGIPQSPPEEKDGVLETMWSDWQDSDTGGDKVEARVEGLSHMNPPPPPPIFWLFGLI